jgi:tetratricopeptide (TPR) repeat protein
MREQIQFIGRQKELKFIDECIKDETKSHLICIHGEGGIGKTRLIQEVRQKYFRDKSNNFMVLDIIDFDNLNFHLAESVWRKIAEIIDQKTFEPFFRVLSDYHKMVKAGVSPERLREVISENYQTFIKCFNVISEQKRIIMFFDTTDALLSDKVFISRLIEIKDQLKNSVILIAGRDAENIYHNSLQKKDTLIDTNLINLEPMKKQEAQQYLDIKQDNLLHNVEGELSEKLLILSGRKPILMDLAVEWLAREIPIELLKKSLSELESLSEDERIKLQEEFEKQLVSHIIQSRSLIDKLILVMARVFPLNQKMATEILNESEDKVKELFEDAKNYVFIKVLPDGQLTLHDKMRSMIDDYVWDEVDPSGDRRKNYSKLAENYIGKEIHTLKDRIVDLEHKNKITQDVEEQWKISEEIESIEQELLVLKRRNIVHSLYVDTDKGIMAFIDAYEDAMRKWRFSFIGAVIARMRNFQKKEKKLSHHHIHEIDIREIRYLLLRGEYQKVKELANNILESDHLSDELRIEGLISSANAAIRLGNVNAAISLFSDAVKISEENSFLLWSIRSLKELGWAYRLTGDLESAFTYYRNAQNLCLSEMITQTEKDNLRQLNEEYGSISNNLIFILAAKRESPATLINLALETIKHWKQIGNKLGLGRCHSALGIVYFQNNLYEDALKSFQNALSIFNDLDLKSELGNTYSWRGATYLRMENLDDAQKDFEKSLTIGDQNIKAMTLYRMGHLYFNRKKWELSEKYLRESIEYGKTIPNFTYWLLSMARLCMLPTEEPIKRFDEINEMLDVCRSKAEKLPQNSLGLVYIGIARLLLLQSDTHKKDKILNTLKDGIALTIEHESEAHTDILHWLDLFEKDFDKVSSEIIHSIGREMIEYVAKKEVDNLTYMKIKSKLYHWTQWGRNING